MPEKDPMEMVKNIGGASGDTVAQLHKIFTDNPRVAEVVSNEMKNKMGAVMDHIFGLSPEEQRMMDGLSDATKDLTFAACRRAIETGGKISYERSDTGSPKLNVRTEEVAIAQPGSSEPHPSKVNVHFHCMK